MKIFTHLVKAFLIIICLFTLSKTNGQSIAFPCAEGYGKNASGGRGGTVVKVTNLNDAGAGSFRAAVSAPNRIVVFEVAGYIDLTSSVDIASNITIAGQTAFVNGGDGITIRKSASNPFSGIMLSAGSNLIIRYIRFRPGQRFDNDCCGDAILMYNESNIIFDHVSASYGSDELLDFSGSTNITLQNCFFAEPLSEVNPAAGGKLLMLTYTENISILRTLLANSGQRNPLILPKLSNSAIPANYEFANNYGFNLGSFGLSFQENGTTPFNVNIMNNYWHESAEGYTSRRYVMLNDAPNSKYYVNDENFDSRYRPTTTGTAWNLITTDAGDYGSNFSVPQNTLYQTLTPFNTPVITDNISLVGGLSVWSSFENDFGASVSRDAADIRVISQINANSAPNNNPSTLDENTFGTAYGVLNNMSSVPADANNNGIPDTWESANMGGANANDIAPSGYTWIEEYINNLAFLGSCGVSCTITTANITDSICNTDSLLFGGVYYKIAGVYKDTVTGSNSCDSITTLTLNINNNLCTTSPCSSIYPQDTIMTQVNYNPPTPLPGYLASFTEENFGNKVTRISNLTNFGGDSQFLRHGYAKRQVWNSDGSFIVLAGYNPKILDGTTYTLLGTATGFGNMGFSNTNPLLSYQTSGSDNYFIKQLMNPSTYVSTTIFRRDFTNYNILGHQSSEANVSADDKYIALYGTKVSTGGDCWVVVYDIELDSIYSETNLGVAFSSIDWVSMSQSGDYVVVLFNTDGSASNQGTKSYDKNMNLISHITNRTSHGDLGYDINGNEVLVSNSSGYIKTNRLDGIGSEILYINVSGGHVSCRNINRPGWAYFNDHGTSSSPGDYDAFREVLAVKLDEKPGGIVTVNRFAKSYSYAGIGYNHQPQAVASPDGAKVLFASNMEDPTTEAQSYPFAFVVETVGGSNLSSPTSLSASPNTGCDSYSTTLSGTCASGVIRWFTSASDTGVGVSATQTITANTTFYAKCYDVAEPVTCRYSSSANISLTIINSVTASISDNICQGDSVLFGAVYRKIGGTYTETVTGSNTCDSITTLTLSVTNSATANISNSICNTDSLLFGGVYYKTAGTYKDTLTGSNSCDSITTLTLSIDNNLCAQNPCNSAYPPQVDLSTYNFGSYVVPASTPAYLGVVNNAATGTQTTRISDGNVSAFQNVGDVQQIRHAYSKNQVWNNDGSYLTLSGNNPFILDGNTYQVLARTNMPSIWSNVNRLKAYGSYDNVFYWRIMNETTYQGDYNDYVFNNYTRMNMQTSENNISIDDRYVALYGVKASTGTDCWVVIFDILNLTIVSETNLGTPESSIDWVSMSQDGSRVVIMYNTNGSGPYQGTKSYNQNLTGVIHLSNGTPHGDLGVDVNGNQVFVSVGATGNYGISMIDLLTGVTTGLWLKTGADYAGVAHISCRNIDRPGWAYLTGGENSGGGTFDRYPSYLKMLTVKLDPVNPNTGEFWGWNNARQGQVKYNHQGHGCPSRDGKKVIFASDWDDNVLEAQNFAPAWIMETVSGSNLTAPTSLSATPNTGCDNYSTSLSGNCASGLIRWYNNAIDTGVGISSTQTITSNTTFYAKCYDVTEPITCRYSSETNVSLTINNSTVASINNSICDSDSVLFGGIYLKAGGIYKDTVTGSNGCDSITTLTLSIDNGLCGEEVCYSSSNFNIDGSEEVLWINTYYDTLNKLIAGTSSGNSDLFSTFNLSWDNTNLYLIAEITDDIKTNDSPGSVWTDDGIEIFIDGNNEKNVVYDANDRQYILRWNDNTVYEYGFNTGTNPVGVVFNQTTTATGYIMEVSIAWSSIGVTPVNGKTIGFEIQVNDDDDGGSSLEARKSWFALASPSSDASLMGSIKLTNDTCVISCSPTTASISDNICQGDSVLFGGVYRKIGGTYTETVTGSNSCDSITTLNLSINPASIGYVTQTICQGDSVLFNGIYYKTSGVYSDTLTGSNTCDSISNLVLIIEQPTITVNNVTICQGDSAQLGVVYYKNSGTYSVINQGSNGCDSITYLNLTVLPLSSESISQTICQGDSLLFDGIYQTISGTYSSTNQGGNGCDSVTTLNLTVSPAIVSYVNDTICEGDSLYFNNTYLTIQGNYTENQTSSIGCDSTIKLKLFVNRLTTLQANSNLDTISVGGTVSFSGTSSSSLIYIWDFGDMSFSTQQNTTHTYNVPGVYTVILEGELSSGCVMYDTLTITVLNNVGIDEGSFLGGLIEVYPNPTKESFYVSFDLKEKLEVEIEIHDLKGKLIASQIRHVQQTKVLFKNGNYERGTYFVKVKSGDRYTVKRLVVIR